MRQTITQRPALASTTPVPSIWQLRTLYEADSGIADAAQVVELGGHQTVAIGRQEDAGSPSAPDWLAPGASGSEGSGPARWIGLADGMVSRRQAMVGMTPGGPRLRDSHSKNGTWINGERLPAGGERTLSSGDIVQVGHSFLMCRCEPPVFGDPGADAAGDASSRAMASIRGVSLGIARLRAELTGLARLRSRVLVLGESGTGKEEVAQALGQLARHFAAMRGLRPPAADSLVVIDCSALAPNLIESELFGHRKGAFTGATNDHIGAFERAKGGTVFLDEIGELPLDLQPKLLRVLEQKEVRRVGDSVMRPVDVQVVAATNRDLEASCQAGRFREELLARLAGAVLRLPPLRERREDILLLARHFAGPDLRLSVRLVNAMLTYDWPLNVRELRNLMVDELPRGEEHVLRRLSSERPRSVSTPPSAESRPSDPSALLGSNKRRPAHGPSDAPPSREAMAELLQNHHGNLSLLERVTGYSRRHLRRLASEDYGLDLDAYRSAAAPPAPSDLRAQK